MTLTPIPTTSPCLDLIMGELGKTKEGIVSLGRLREFSRGLREKVDHVVMNSQVFRASFLTRPNIARGFRQLTSFARLNELYFRNVMKHPRSKLEEGIIADVQAIEKARKTFNLSLGVDLNEYDAFGYTLLHRACGSGPLGRVQTLLNSGAKIDATSAIGSTPLCHAVQYGRVNVIQLLLERGANPNGVPWEEKPPIMWLTDCWSSLRFQDMLGKGKVSEVAELLVRNGADVINRNDPDNCFLSVAFKHNKSRLLQELATTFPQKFDLEDALTQIINSLAHSGNTKMQYIYMLLDCIKPHLRLQESKKLFHLIFDALGIDLPYYFYPALLIPYDQKIQFFDYLKNLFFDKLAYHLDCFSLPQDQLDVYAEDLLEKRPVALLQNIVFFNFNQERRLAIANQLVERYPWEISFFIYLFDLEEKDRVQLALAIADAIEEIENFIHCIVQFKISDQTSRFELAKKICTIDPDALFDKTYPVEETHDGQGAFVLGIHLFDLTEEQIQSLKKALL